MSPGRTTTSAGTPALLSAATVSSRSQVAKTAARCCSSSSWTVGVVGRAICRPSSRPSRGGRASPPGLRIAWRLSTASANHFSSPTQAKIPWRCPSMLRLPIPAELVAVRRELDHLFRRHIEGGVDHDRLTQLAPARRDRGRRSPPAQRRRRASPAMASQGPRGLVGGPSAIAGQVGQPGQLFHRLGQAHPLPPRAPQPEGRHPHEHGLGAAGARGLRRSRRTRRRAGRSSRSRCRPSRSNDRRAPAPRDA